MRINRKLISNIGFIIIIGLMLYPPTKVYFIRLISFSPSFIEESKQQKVKNYDWSLKGLNTNNVNFNQLEGKVIFVSFWATWCSPCVAELPSMNKLYNDYKENVVFLFITNENWKTVNSFYKKKEYDFPTFNSQTKTPVEFYSKSIPATFILDKKGNIVVNKKGTANWNSKKVRNLLDNLILK